VKDNAGRETPSRRRATHRAFRQGQLCRSPLPSHSRHSDVAIRASASGRPVGRRRKPLVLLLSGLILLGVVTPSMADIAYRERIIRNAEVEAGCFKRAQDFFEGKGHKEDLEKIVSELKGRSFCSIELNHNAFRTTPRE
jgi:hypothetical protein